jgi:predicted NBD/HSP70 family sugar kinase
VLAAAGGDYSRITIDLVAREADRGDPLAREVVLAAAEKIGNAVSNAVVLLDPGTVVLSGSLIHSSRLCFETVAAIVHRLALASPSHRREIAVLRAQIGPLAGAVGAAGIVHQRRLGLHEAVRLVP